MYFDSCRLHDAAELCDASRLSLKRSELDDALLKMKDAAAGIITDNVSYFRAISAIRRKGPLNASRLFKLLNASLSPKAHVSSLSLFLKVQADLLI